MLQETAHWKSVKTAVMSSGLPPWYLFPFWRASFSKGVVVLPQLYFRVTPTMAFTMSWSNCGRGFSPSVGMPSFQNVLTRPVRSFGHRLSNRPSDATRHRSPACTFSESAEPLAGYE